MERNDDMHSSNLGAGKGFEEENLDSFPALERVIVGRKGSNAATAEASLDAPPGHPSPPEKEYPGRLPSSYRRK